MLPSSFERPFKERAVEVCYISIENLKRFNHVLTKKRENGVFVLKRNLKMQQEKPGHFRFVFEERYGKKISHVVIVTSSVCCPHRSKARFEKLNDSRA